MKITQPAVVGVLALTGAVLAFGSRGEAATGPATVRIVDVELSHHVVRPRNGGAMGSVELIRQRLYSPRADKTPIGTAALSCVFLDRRERSCTGTYRLPKGSLVVAGAIESRLLFEIAVVGGTGIYDDARGSLTVTSTHLRPRREVLVFRLTG